MGEEERNGFSVESKPFEVSIDGEDRSVKETMTERSRGRVSWVRFGEVGLKL